MDKDAFLKFIKKYNNMMYVCSSCGELIFPNINIINDDIFFMIDKGCIKGGLGNINLKDNICPACQEKLNIIAMIKND